MKKILAAILLVSALGMMPMRVEAAISWSLTNFATSWTAAYDPYWEGAGYTNGDTFTVSVSGASSGAHPYFFTRTTADSSLYFQKWVGGYTYVIPYSVYKNNTPPLVEMKPAALATIDNVISGSISGSNGSANHIYYIIPDEAVTVPASTYVAAANLAFALYGKAFTTNPGGATKTKSITATSITLTVPSYGAVSVMPSSFAYTPGSNIKFSNPLGPSVVFPYATTSQSLDFGSTGESTFATGAAQSCKILVACNTTWGLTVKSENGSKLEQAGSTDEVPYTVTFGGSPANVSVPNAAVPVLTSQSWTNGGYSSYDVAVTVGTVGSWLDAGTYTDTLTFTLSYP